MKKNLDFFDPRCPTGSSDITSDLDIATATSLGLSRELGKVISEEFPPEVSMGFHLKSLDPSMLGNLIYGGFRSWG